MKIIIILEWSEEKEENGNEEENGIGEESKSKETEKNESKDDDIQIIGVTQGTGKIQKDKKGMMDLLEENAIATGKIITDVSINVAQNLIHDQFPTCESMLGSRLQYSICGGEFAGKSHWIKNVIRLKSPKYYDVLTKRKKCRN